MKFLILAACVCLAVAAPPVGNDAQASILRSESDVRPDGFSYSVETDNGIVSEASGQLKQVGDTAAVAVQGAYRYVAPDGTPVQVTYVADENGYQPQSDLLPQAPAIPELIARSLQYNAAHAVAEDKRF